MAKNNNFGLIAALSGVFIFAYLIYRQWQNGGSFFDTVNDIFTKGSLQLEATLSQDISSKAASFIAQQESFSAKAYPDPPGQTEKYSIGYGHQLTGNDGLNINSVIDQPTALSLLSSDLGIAIGCVDSLVEVDLTDNQKIALYSFVYNEGCGSFQKSTLLKLLNSGDYQGAASQFPAWVYARGQVLQSLVNRRNEEMGLFLS